MFKSYARLSLLCALLSLASSARAQEAELAANSSLTGTSLPEGAVRISEQSVPAEIKNALAKFVAAGAGKIRQGDSEVLAWAGGGYRKSDAARLIRQLESGLRADGWAYEVAGKEDQVVVFNLFKASPTRRAVIGFYVPADDALVLAWAEMLPANSPVPAGARQGVNGGDAGNARRTEDRAGAIPRELIGKWDNGSVSMLQYRDTVTGATAPGRGSYSSYELRPDGSFHYAGLLQSTLYNCTTTLFNEKAGRAEVSGAEITFVPTKNFWRKTNNCAPSSNSERDYTLESETYRWRAKQDEYGNQLICLTNDKGESCYRRSKE